jgi:hypothetical protein
MDLFEEIREDIVKKKYIRLWEKYGKFFLIILVTFLIILSLYFTYNYLKISASHKAAKSYNKILLDLEKSYLLDIDKYTNKINNKSLSNNYKTISRLKLAEKHLSLKKYQESFNIYNEIYNNKENLKILRDYSFLLMNHIDYLSDEVTENLEKKVLTSNNIFYFSIIELRLIYFLSLNDKNSFNLEISKIIESTDVSSKIKQRAILYSEIANSK